MASVGYADRDGFTFNQVADARATTTRFVVDPLTSREGLAAVHIADAFWPGRLFQVVRRYGAKHELGPFGITGYQTVSVQSHSR